jgi:hypothetical protein
MGAVHEARDFFQFAGAHLTGRAGAKLRWIERRVAPELIAGKQVDGIRVPPPIAIAHHLIKTWALAEE